MKKRLYILLTLTLVLNSAFAQKATRIELKKLKNSKNETVQSLSNGFKFVESIQYVDIVEKETNKGNYLQLLSKGLTKSYDEGNPNLPLITRLIEIPKYALAKVNVISYSEEIIKLTDYNLEKEIIPAQASVSKSVDPNKVPFIKNNKVYSTNAFFKNDIVKFTDRGYLRDKHLGYIEISPFQYNPVTKELKVLNDIEIEISFINDVNSKLSSRSKLSSPYFDNLKLNTLNKVEGEKAIIEGPVKYVIVSDSMFMETLEPFIEWKTRKGYNVITVYKNAPGVGNTTNSIKAYLQDLYENPEDGIAPTFVLIVGDVAQIPAFNTKLSGDYHVTDLYYMEYTDDMLPDVIYGRFSATTVEELQPQIEKTIMLEQYTMADPLYLDNVVLVAGVDAGAAPTFGNGFVNYSNDYYTNSENGINSYYYLYNDTSGVMASNSSGASASIRSYISSGASLVNYTAHCAISGWSDPSFTISHIDGLTNENMYPLVIGNCCQSVKFEGNSFGEAIVRASGKGSVGYIGGSDYTYWDEDYFWGVGLASISANPTYENSGLGSYDRFFHMYGEDKSDWYVTQGQIVIAGNMAVEESSSYRKAYYWEIYHLMGDPSLVPYVTVPEELTASYDTALIVNTSSFQVLAEENSYVALTKDSIILDTKLVNESGIANLEFDTLKEVGQVYLVITKQNRQPIIDTLNIIADSKPNVYMREFSFSEISGNLNEEIDYGETVALNIKLENSSSLYDAQNVVLNISTLDTNAVILDGIENVGTINKANFIELAEAITIQFKNRFSDKQLVEFDLNITWDDATKTSYNKTFKFNAVVNAPVLKINDLIIDDLNGNNDGIIDPGEDASLKLEIENTGSSLAQNVYGKVIQVNGTDLLTMADSSSLPVNINPGEIREIEFNVSLDSYESYDLPVSIDFVVKEDDYNYYSDTDLKEFVIGAPQNVKISTQGTVSVENKGAYFYDSGGEDQNYLNNENYTITFTPEDENSKLSVEFLMFDIEAYYDCRYDKMTIYDSSIVDASALVGSYCGTDSPGFITATNMDGALTFVFTSDVGLTEKGWKAKLSQVGTYSVTFNITGKDDLPLKDVNISLSGNSKSTNDDGLAIFYNVVPQPSITYVLSKSDYIEYSGTFDVKDQDVTIDVKMISTGIDPELISKIRVFPNPSNGIFNVEMQDLNEQILVFKVYDVLGNIIYTEKKTNNNNDTFEIDLTDRAKGIYILNIESSSGNLVTRRLLLQ